MRNPSTKKASLNWVKGGLLLLCLLFNFASQKAFSATAGSLSCSASGASAVIDIEPGTTHKMPVSVSCTVLRDFPTGGSLGFETGTQLNGISVKILNVGGSSWVPQVSNGSSSTYCVPNGGLCTTLKKGTNFRVNLEVQITVAANATGMGSVLIAVGVTNRSDERYAEDIFTKTQPIRVLTPTCYISTGPVSFHDFGSITTLDFEESPFFANIQTKCSAAVSASMILVPGQAAVAGSPGYSSTDLEGVSILVTRDNRHVEFNIAQDIQLRKGTDKIPLAFKLQKNIGADNPAGNFNATFTLSITYP
ncbi:fimbrial protein [Pseudomonas sp. ArH3a]|uniref:fimbrial protein n=1 Tax=Pseudomonas sp. ArH3a TaxID=2862945 RepID=UPI001F5A1EC1|nr:fimbrial protein [Pseudomonas sp. ArH3a]UNM20057.1 fimbrial protein [Pseudomonas sp. ArH3a]